MSTNQDLSNEEPKAKKRATGAKRITNKQVWEELEKLSAQVSSVGGQLASFGTTDYLKAIAELGTKLEAKDERMAEELGQMRSEIESIGKRISAIGDHESPLKLQFLELGEKLDGLSNQMKENAQKVPVEIKQEKKWYQFWKS